MVRTHRVALAVLAAVFSTAVIIVACTRLLQAEPPAAPASPVVGKPAESKPSVERRAVDKKVKDFPEKTDLSTPESALAAYERAFARLDAKAVAKLGWYTTSSRELAELDRWLKHDAKDAAAYRDILLNEKIIEVLTYRNDIAQVIYTMKVPKSAGKDAVANPYGSRSFGRINGQWKNLGENRLPSVQAARDWLDANKDFRWQQFTELRDDVIAGRAVLARRVAAPGGYYFFGPVIERTIHAVDEGHDSFLNLDTGKLCDAPDPAPPKGLSPASN